LDQILDAANQHRARVVLISTIVTHADAHLQHMRRLDELARQRGVRQQLVLIAGGTQITDEMARQCGMDAGFGRGTKGRDVGSFVVRKLQSQEKA
jgi:D-ornithine 4,5-aminomutase subunit beta